MSNLVTGLKNGTKSPESIITYILTKPEYFTAAGSTAGGFLDRLSTTFAKLFTQTTQLTGGHARPRQPTGA